MATSETPDIRGALRAELIRRLALGDETHEELGVEFERSTQAITNFSSRNKDEIRRTKQALIANVSDEWVAVAIARKMDRIADADQDWEDLKELLQDEGLTPSQRRHYLALKDKLRHSVAEELGQLPTRSTVELEVRQNPLEGIDRIVVDEDGGWHAVDSSPSTGA
jgi:hypothetical protein